MLERVRSICASERSIWQQIIDIFAECSIDYIEDLIERENVFTMEEFSKSVNEFLAFRRYDILKDNGRISHKQAVEKAYQEYVIFNKTQPIESDFDKIVKGLEMKI